MGSVVELVVEALLENALEMVMATLQSSFQKLVADTVVVKNKQKHFEEKEEKFMEDDMLQAEAKKGTVIVSATR